MNLSDLLGVASPRWMNHPDRNCNNPAEADKWFPGKIADGYQAARNATELCEGCPVLLQCRAYAVADSSLDGIWGGTTPGDRVRLRSGKPMADRRVGYGHLARRPMVENPNRKLSPDWARRPVKECVACHRMTRIHARGMCSTCSKRTRREEDAA